MMLTCDHPALAMALVPLVPCGLTLAWWLRRRQRLARQAWGVETTADGVRWSLTVLATVSLLLASCGFRSLDADAALSPAGRDLVIVLDLSRSMTATDALPDRCSAAKAALADLTRLLEARGGHRIGVVAFAGAAIPVCPLTADLSYVRHSLANLDVATPPAALRGAGGTRIGSGLVGGMAMLEHGSGAILLASDGDDPADDGEWQVGVRAAQAAGVPVHVLAVGDGRSPVTLLHDGMPVLAGGQPVRSRQHVERLRLIARDTGGDYLAWNVAGVAWEPFVRQQIDRLPGRALVQPTRRGKSLAGMFVVVALLAWGVGQFVGRVRVHALRWSVANRLVRPAWLLVALALIAASKDADLFRGDARYRRGEYAEAIVAFERALRASDDPGPIAARLAACRFHQGRYAEAERRYRQALSDATGERRWSLRYDLATATLHRSASIDAAALREAIAAFEALLADLPAEHALVEDAKANRLLATELLQALPAANGPPSAGDPDRTRPGDGTGNPGDGSPSKQVGTPKPTDAPREGATENDAPRPAGAGTLPVLNADGPDPSPAERRQWIAEAERRVRQADAERRRRWRWPVTANGGDW